MPRTPARVEGEEGEREGVQRQCAALGCMLMSFLVVSSQQWTPASGSWGGGRV